MNAVCKERLAGGSGSNAVAGVGDFYWQIWTMTSLTPGERKRICSQYKSHGKFYLPWRRVVLHGSTSHWQKRFRIPPLRTVLPDPVIPQPWFRSHRQPLPQQAVAVGWNIGQFHYALCAWVGAPKNVHPWRLISWFFRGP